MDRKSSNFNLRSAGFRASWIPNGWPAGRQRSKERVPRFKD